MALAKLSIGMVCDRAELFHWRSAHALGGGVGASELGIPLLQPLQLLHQGVVFGIGDLRVIQDIVAVVVILDLPPERCCPLCRLVWSHNPFLAVSMKNPQTL
jgi:hypothetical protein